MKKMKYGIAVTCLTVGMMLAITACGGKKAESTETAAQTAVVVETQTDGSGIGIDIGRWTDVQLSDR